MKTPPNVCVNINANKLPVWGARGLLFRLFNVFMAVLVLTTSTGFGLVEHSCLMRGKSVSIYKKTPDSTACKACEAKRLATQQQQTLKKSKCCTEKTSFENVDYSSSIVQYATKFLKSVVEAVAMAFVHLLEALTQAVVSLFTHLFSSIAHALAGRSLLVFIQVFQI